MGGIRPFRNGLIAAGTAIALAIGFATAQQPAPTTQHPQTYPHDAAERVHPERFVRQAPKPAAVPTEVWINKPLNADEKTH